jgi:plasmid stabilization system protein ParE
MPQDIWTDTQDRQYQHIMHSLINSGRSEADAKEIAARTINKQRFEHGETANKVTMGTGNPHTSLSERSKQQLLNRAKQLDITGRSDMNKKELVSAIRSKH